MCSIFARREAQQEGKGEAIIYKHEIAKIRPRNAQLVQKKKETNCLLRVNGIMFPSLINCTCNNAQRDCICHSLDLTIVTCKR